MAELCVVGAAGGLGNACVRVAVAAGHGTRALMRTPRTGLFQQPSSAASGRGHEAQIVACDVRDVQSLTRAAEGCSALLYCVNVPLERWHSELPLMLRSAIEACRATGARLVFPGNVWSFGPGVPGVLIDETRPLTPSSRKGRVRQELEQLMATAGVDYVNARLPEFFGPNVINALMGAPFRAALAGKTILWPGTQLDVNVEYLYVDDGARALLTLALAKDVSGQTFHVPASAPTTPRAFWQLVQELAGSRASVRTVPRPLLRTAAVVSATVREFVDILHLWTHPILLDGTRYAARFGQVPATPYRQSIQETLSWFRAHPPA